MTNRATPDYCAAPVPVALVTDTTHYLPRPLVAPRVLMRARSPGATALPLVGRHEPGIVLDLRILAEELQQRVDELGTALRG